MGLRVEPSALRDEERFTWLFQIARNAVADPLSVPARRRRAPLLRLEMQLHFMQCNC